MVTIQPVCVGGSKELYNASRCALWKINSSSTFANVSLSLTHMPTHTHHTHTYRSALCTHLQCFDASVYLQMNEKWVVKERFLVWPLPQPSPAFVAWNVDSASNNTRCKGLAAMARFLISGLQSLAYVCTLTVMNLWAVRLQNSLHLSSCKVAEHLSSTQTIFPLSMWPKYEVKFFLNGICKC